MWSASKVLTKLPDVPDSADAVPGMAFYRGSGPAGKTCGDCIHRGYLRQSQKGHWNAASGRDVFRSYRVQSCEMFKKLAGFHGPPVERENPSCKYFESRK